MLTTLPDEIGELKELKVLLVAGNPVTLEEMIKVVIIQKISSHTYEMGSALLSLLYGSPPPPQASHEALMQAKRI